MKKIILLAALLVIAVVAIMTLKNNDSLTSNTDNAGVPQGDPLDVVSPFYNDWFDAVVSTSTDPYQAGLAADGRLTGAVQEYITSRQADMETMDPVLCQLTVPPRVGAKVVFQTEAKAQFMILPRGLDNPVPERAIVDVEGVDGEWKITKIECISGEGAPRGEFTFEKHGHLLKNNEPPLNPDTWYVVYEENGIDGHFAPLTFSAESMCVNAGGEELVCDEGSFLNASEVTVKGEMSEVGVDVKRVEFVN